MLAETLDSLPELLVSVRIEIVRKLERNIVVTLFLILLYFSTWSCFPEFLVLWNE